jgi:hypothetical protein
MKLQKADVWIQQFRSRLNWGIIAMVLLWGAVSYFKSTGMQLAARALPEPERIVADGSLDEIPTVEVNSLQREIEVETVESVEVVETEEAENNLPVNAAKAAPTETFRQDPAQNIISSVESSQRSKKKSVASKPAP